mmetsp:Transcript_33200/g.88151  ORF Transcript_33200/g.88151 Transcript_33200/m.88151 type:complete len:80 (+) Transcript_33200:257-496(+)
MSKVHETDVDVSNARIRIMHNAKMIQNYLIAVHVKLSSFLSLNDIFLCSIHLAWHMLTRCFRVSHRYPYFTVFSLVHCI